MTRLFLLSPANASGVRGRLLRSSSTLALAKQLRSDEGAPIGDVYAFISSLYFRGKLAYATRFAPDRTLVITPCRGLLPPETRLRQADFEQLASVPIDADEPRFVEPLLRDVERCTTGVDEVVLLGSVASPKYVAPLLDVLGTRLVFPETFVGRGDMSRGGVLLRAASAGEELSYVPVAGAQLHGARPPKLPKR